MIPTKTIRTERRMVNQTNRNYRVADIIAAAQTRANREHPSEMMPPTARHFAMIEGIVKRDLAERIAALEDSERQMHEQLSAYETTCLVCEAITGHQLDAEAAVGAALDLREQVRLSGADKPIDRTAIWTAAALLAAAVGLDELCPACAAEEAKDAAAEPCCCAGDHCECLPEPRDDYPEKD